MAAVSGHGSGATVPTRGSPPAPRKSPPMRSAPHGSRVPQLARPAGRCCCCGCGDGAPSSWRASRDSSSPGSGGAASKRSNDEDDDALPDASRTSWLLGLLSANVDLSVPVLYGAVMETTEYRCDPFTLAATYYGLRQAVRPALALLCGFIADATARSSHNVLLAVCMLLTMLQAATSMTEDVWVLGAIFIARTALTMQASTQALKLLVTRATKVYSHDGRAKRKLAQVQRVGALSDVWSCLLEAVAFALAAALPGQTGRQALEAVAMACTFGVVLIVLTVSRRELTLRRSQFPNGSLGGSPDPATAGLLSGSPPDAVQGDTAEEQRHWSDIGSAGPETGGGESDSSWDYAHGGAQVRGGGGNNCTLWMRNAWLYLLSGREWFQKPAIALALGHYLTLQVFSVLATLPLSQQQASGVPFHFPWTGGNSNSNSDSDSDAAVVGAAMGGGRVGDATDCDTLLEDIYVQGFFVQLVYLAGSLAYLYVFAQLRPATFFTWAYPVLALVILVGSSIFYMEGVAPAAAGGILACVQTVAFYSREYDVWFLAATVREQHYGYFLALPTATLSLAGALAGWVSAAALSNTVETAIAQGVVLVTVCVGCAAGRKRAHVARPSSHGSGRSSVGGDARDDTGSASWRRRARRHSSSVDGDGNSDADSERSSETPASPGRL